MHKVYCQFGRSFSAWLQSTTGGGKKAKQAEISVTRAFKFLKYCYEQSLLSTVELVDYFLCSSKFLTDFLDHLETTWQVGMPGRLGYVTGIADLLDFRRFNSPPGPILQISFRYRSLQKTCEAMFGEADSVSLDDRSKYRQSQIQKQLGYAC